MEIHLSNVTIPQWLIRLAIVVALPTVACFGYYSVSAFDDGNRALALPVVLAYPAILIGGIGLESAINSSHRSALTLWAWSSVIVSAAVLLTIVWY